MPYIEQKDRSRVEQGDVQTAGELNYAVTLLLINYIRTKGLSYAHINDCLGALEGAKLEFQRRIISKYEDEKIKINGDVY